MDNQKNLILAIVMSIGIVFLFQEYFFPKPAPVAPTTTQTTPGQVVPGQTTLPGTPGQTTAPVQRKREDILKDSARVRIATPKLTGSIALTGAVIDDITLLNYRQTIEKNSPNVVLLAPKGTKDAYFAQFGWVSTQTGVKLPDADTKWTADSEQLGPGKPVTLTWDNDEGLKFTRLYAIDENYLVTVTDRVENVGTATVPLSAYGLMRRHGTPVTQGFFILHEGPIGVFRKDSESTGSLEEIDYSDVKKGKDKKRLERPSLGGWLGLSDHYWLVALIPDQSKKFDTAFRYLPESDFYQADFRGETAAIKPGDKLESKTQFYVGAKELNVIQDYKDRHVLPKFDLAIDFGWFYFLTKPLFLLIEIFFQWAGNFGVAILMLTILVKALLFPLANKSYKSMSNMKKLQPELMKLRERYKDDRQKLNQEMMAMYKREKINPAAGCWPILVQIPIFFALYKVLFVAIEMRHAPFFGWIRDLSAPDPTSMFNLFGLIPWTPPSFLMIGVWPLLMGITMFLQQKLNPPPADPIQQKIFTFLPVVFTFMLASFPAGMVIYWSWSNTLSIVQQYIIMKRHGAFEERRLDQGAKEKARVEKRAADTPKAAPHAKKTAKTKTKS